MYMGNNIHFEVSCGAEACAEPLKLQAKSDAFWEPEPFLEACSHQADVQIQAVTCTMDSMDF